MRLNWFIHRLLGQLKRHPFARDLPEVERNREAASFAFLALFVFIVAFYNPFYVVLGWWDVWVVNLGCIVVGVLGLTLMFRGRRRAGKMVTAIGISTLGAVFNVMMGEDTQMHFALLMAGFVYPFWFSASERGTGLFLVAWNTSVALVSAVLARWIQYSPSMTDPVRVFVEVSFAALFFAAVVFLSFRVTGKLEELAKKQKQILGTLADVVLVVDSEGEIKSIDGSGLTTWFARFLPCSGLSEVLAPSDLKKLQEWFLQTQESSQEQHLLCLEVWPILDEVTEQEILPVFELRASKQSPELAVVIIRDMTELKQKARQEEDARERLVQSSKMALLGEMAAGIGHEINNPLSVILGSLRSMRRIVSTQAENSEKILSQIEKCEQMSKRVSQIVGGFKGFARNGERDPAVALELHGLVSESLELCQQRLRKARVRVDAHVPAELVVMCTPVQLSQVLLNLIGNAADALEDQERRLIRLRAGHVDTDLPVELASDEWLQQNRGCSFLLVEDSGPGIPEQLVEQVFDPFFTTKPVGKGTGLGLSISRSILQAQNADLEYRRLKGGESLGGACFLIVFGQEGVGMQEQVAA